MECLEVVINSEEVGAYTILLYIFTTVLVYRKRVLSNKTSYYVCEFFTFCTVSFVCYTQCYRLMKCSLAAGNTLLRLVQTQSTKQNGCPGDFCSLISARLKNCLCYHFAVYPTNESCSQRCSRRIILLRSSITILLASYSSKSY